ncbi:hypothetical protein NPIL_149341 [Nephila pilipes]|uniref:Uncharacterized protein n=1 Tax=Nephila pilipes TaxID=299642 RepID=A0A8X6PHV8_NEPPI|nr:hypothetical protein NPIL_149341 [Nephila pilipes]
MPSQLGILNRLQHVAPAVLGTYLTNLACFCLFTDSCLLPRFDLNERNRLRVAERRQRETADQRQTWLRAQQSHDYNRLAFR